MTIELVRVIAVVVLLGISAAIATPRGRLPLALRGLNRMLGRPSAGEKGERVPGWRRLVAFALVLAAVVVAVVI